MEPAGPPSLVNPTIAYHSTIMQNLGQLSVEYDVGLADVKKLDLTLGSLEFVDLSLGFENRFLLNVYNAYLEILKSQLINHFRDNIAGLVSGKVSACACHWISLSLCHQTHREWGPAGCPWLLIVMYSTSKLKWQ